MPTIAERFQIAGEGLDPLVPGSELDAHSLFICAYDVYAGRNISPAFISSIENILPGNSLFFMTRGDEYLHPEGLKLVPVELIRETIKNDTACIFRRQLYINRKINEIDCTLFCVSLGRDAADREISAGLIFSHNWSRTDLNEDRMFCLLGQIRRWYDTFCESASLREFVRNAGAFQYVIDPETGETILRHFPREYESSEQWKIIDSQVTQQIIPGIISSGEAVETGTSMTTWFKNLKISKIRLIDSEYILLSFEPSDDMPSASQVDARLFGEFTHELRGKLGAIRTAASQLSMQEGCVVEPDDVQLLKLIDSAIESADELVSRFKEKYNYRLSGVDTDDEEESIEKRDLQLTAEMIGE